MLKNLHPALQADVLYRLRSLGHGVFGELLRIASVSAAGAFRAVLSVLPLDTPLQPSVGRMEIMGAPDEIPAVQAEVQAEIDAAEGQSAPMYGIERFKFYDEAKKAYAVIQTGETRFYGCFLITKGVVPPVSA